MFSCRCVDARQRILARVRPNRSSDASVVELGLRLRLRLGLGSRVHRRAVAGGGEASLFNIAVLIGCNIAGANLRGTSVVAK